MSRNLSLHQLFTRYWDHLMERDPFLATHLGDHRFNDRVPDLTREARQSSRDILAGMLAESSAMDPAALPEADRISRSVFQSGASVLVADLDHRMYQWKVDQLYGPQVIFFDNVRFHPTGTEKDLEDLLARYRAFPRYLDGYIENLADGIREGRTSPRVAVDRVIPQIQRVLDTAPESSPLIKPVEQASSVPDSIRSGFRERYLEAIRDGVYAGFRTLLTYLRDTYAAKARETVGAWSITGGAEVYRHCIRKCTTTDYTADEIHRMGLEDLETIHEELSRIASRMGSASGRELLQAIKTDPRNFATSRDDLLDRYREAFARAQAALPRVFGKLPKTPCEVRSIDPTFEKDAPAAYYYGPPDDRSRPGIYFANTYRPETRPLYDVECLTYHEGVPGHHLQVALATESETLPRFRRFEASDAFCEGWALYAERLSEELGLYTSDLSRAGMLSAQALRTCRLVVDTGIHEKRWTRDQAIRFMGENLALPPTTIEVEVDRYIIWPGQALSYSVGMREILRLRNEASQKLKDRMDLRAFHDTVLEEGTIPLTVLAQRVKSWVETVSGS